MQRGVLGLVLAAVCSLAPPAAAQTGAFVGRSIWGPVGSNGANGTISLDANFDGQLENYPAPAAIGALGSAQLQASPSRQFLYARQTQPVTGCAVGQHKILYYRFEPQTPTSGNLLPVMEGQFCIAGSVPAHDGLFESPLAAQRIAYIAELVSSGSQQRLYWVNLNGLNDWTSVQMVRSIDPFISFAPGGQAALVRHDVGGFGVGSDPTRADHSVIDLCPSPRLGTALSGDPQTQNALSNLLQPAASAAMIEPAPDELAVRVTHPNLGATGMLDLPIADCTGVTPPPPPPLQRLSVSISGAGGVYSTPGGIQCSATENDCEEFYAPDLSVTLQAQWNPVGTVFVGWGGACASAGTSPQVTVAMTAARSCTATFGFYRLELQMQGPATVSIGTPITYTLSYANTGTIAVTGVVVSSLVPTSTAFISATSGGGLQAGAAVWNLGPLAAGASGQVSYTVSTQTTAACRSSLVVSHDYRIDSDQTNLLFGSPSIPTELTATSSAPITVSVVSTPAGPILRGGDLVTHSVTLTNTVAQPRACVRVEPLAGQAAHWDSVIDAAGGTVTQSGPTIWNWVGELAANETRTIVWATRVDDCFNPAVTSTRLNADYGGVFAHVGLPIVGFGATQAFPIVQAVTGSIRVEGAGTAGIPQPTGVAQGPGVLAEFVQAVRSPAAVTLELQLRNAFAAPAPGMSASFQFPPELAPRGEPPFVGAPPAGTSWDADSRTVSWAGDLGPQGVVTIRIGADLTGGACRVTLYLDAATATCPIDAAVQLLDVPAPPAGEHLLALGRYDGIYAWELGVDSGFEPMLCLASGGYAAMSVDPGLNELWVMGNNAVGVPSFRLRLEPLELEMLGAAVKTALGMTQFTGPLAAAVDPRDGTIVIATDNSGSSRLRRFNPTTRTSSLIGGTLPLIGGLAVTANGLIVANAGSSGLLAIDPASPAAFQTLTDAAWNQMGQGIALSPAGWFVAPFRATPVTQDLVRVDPVTHAFSIEALDLGNTSGLELSAPPFGPFFAELAVAPDGTIYSATNSQIGLLVRPPAGGASFTPSEPSGAPAMVVLEALAYIPGTAAPDRDGDGTPDGFDVCPDAADPAQQDTDGNGRGDACECGDQNGDGRVNVLDLVAINLAIFNPAQVTPLCDTNDDNLCDVQDVIGANLRIFGAPAYCSRFPTPGP